MTYLGVGRVRSPPPPSPDAVLRRVGPTAWLEMHMRSMSMWGGQIHAFYLREILGRGVFLPIFLVCMPYKPKK